VLPLRYGVLAGFVIAATADHRLYEGLFQPKCAVTAPVDAQILRAAFVQCAVRQVKGSR
jgi:hypothetical protein